MNKLTIAAGFAAALALSACQSPEAENVEDAYDNQAEVIDEMADDTANDVAEEGLEDQADMMEEAGDNAAEAVDDGGMMDEGNAM
ncbi:MAG: hypothetical protein H7X93_03440 [Sphingomonadaceae bacterium]|nr:hypothetical protein [Sphingomonadaceae bacterium]